MFVDLPSLIGPWLRAGYGLSTWWDADLPDNQALALGLVHLSGIGGSATLPAIVSPTLDVDAYAATIEQARALTAVVFDAFMLDLPNTVLGGCTVCRVGVLTYPGPQPYDDNDDIRRMSMAFGLTVST